MILNCPSCSTRYLTDPVSFQPNGRMVRCANCGHSWFQKPPDDMPKTVASSPASASLSSTPIDPITPYSRSSRRRLAGSTLALWGLLAIAVFALGWVFYQYKAEIVRGWPQTASLYNLVGINVNATGMDFRDVSFAMEDQDGLTVLVVRGEVINITDQELPIPRVRIILRAADGSELYNWSITLEQNRLGAEATAPFVTRLSSPPLAIDAIEVFFFEGAE